MEFLAGPPEEILNEINKRRELAHMADMDRRTVIRNFLLSLDEDQLTGLMELLWEASGCSDPRGHIEFYRGVCTAIKELKFGISMATGEADPALKLDELRATIPPEEKE